MNVIFVSIDSLNRHYLPAYGQAIEYAVATPNLDRFAQRAAVFDTHYAGSLPCMPARREFFTGIQEFLWRPWGPIEPFDTPAALAARRAVVMTQLVTDHFHYFQHGSHGYFEDYHGFEFIRGHEYDAWRTAPRDPDPTFLRQIKADRPHDASFLNRVAYARNATALRREEDFFAPQVFAGTSAWLRENHQHDRWLLVVDSFDVHTYLHPCRDDVPAYCYSTMMMRPYGWFTPPETQPAAEAGRFLPYTDSPVWRYPARSHARHPASLLYNVQHDRAQSENLAGCGLPDERRLRELLHEALRQLQAPPEQYERLGLSR
jgi:arylsulfatase A-like enzyme